MKKRKRSEKIGRNFGKILFAALFVGICMLSNVTQVQAEYKKVDEDELPLSTMHVYRNMDTSFLKTFPFGTTYEGSVFVELETAQQMIEATDVRLKKDRVVRTAGFYEVGDGGGATYMLSDEQATGGIALKNGLYANIIMDTKVIDGKKWGIINPKQLGAKGDGEAAEQNMINDAVSLAANLAKNDESIFRSIIYLPEGEYKCTNQVQLNVSNVNFVGEGNKSVIFTDNDYRKGIGYYEFFFTVWGATDLYMADFYVEAREVNGYNYMRQMVFIDCNNVYTYRVDLNIPQEAFSKDYYVDKQYSSLTYYSGNRNMTLDNCKLELMCSTYRGANIGVLDFYSRGEENITIMNCELHSDARDEQVGIFTPRSGTDDTYVKNIYFVNNTMYSYQPLDENAAGGWRNMCFTVAYDESKRISNIYIKGNHFIADLDSKLMTFGNGLQSCVVENNMMDIRCTAYNGAFLFDSSVSTPERVLIQNNEIFLTYRDTAGTGKAAILGGKATVKGNKIVSDTFLYNMGYLSGIYEDNTYINLGTLGSLAYNVAEVRNNTVFSYGNLDQMMFYSGQSAEDVVNFTGNYVVDYRRVYEKNDIWNHVAKLQGSMKELVFSDNTYLAPNKLYWTWSGGTKKSDFVHGILFHTTNIENAVYKNNVLQGANPYFAWACEVKDLLAQAALEPLEATLSENSIDLTEYETVESVSGNSSEVPLVPSTIENESVESDSESTSTNIVNLEAENNQILEYTLNPETKVSTSVGITKDGVIQTEIFTDQPSVTLGTIVKAAYIDENGEASEESVVTNKELVWYSSLEGIGTVNNGVVTRKNYGEVAVFAVPTDGGRVFGKCKIHFVKGFATGITFEKDEITLQTSKKYKAMHEVLPVDKASQKVKWTSSNEGVATVSSIGVIEAIAVGEADITCSTLDGTGISKKIHVKVEPLTVKSITLNTTDWYDFNGDKANPVYDKGVNIGETFQLEVRAYKPSEAVNKGIKKWVSTNEKVATVDANGLVKAVGGGKCEIRAYSLDETCYGTCVVWVQPDKILKDDITETHTNTSIKLSWKPVENVYGYIIYCDKGDGNGYQNVGETTETVHNSWFLEAGKTYKYQIATYTRRTDCNGYKHTYETRSDEISVTTYTNSVITSFNTNKVETIGVRKGEEASFAIYTGTKEVKSKVSYSIDNENICSVRDGNPDDPNWDLRILGKEEGTANLIVTANDELGYTKSYPVLVYDFQKTGSNISVNPLIKSICVKWKVEDASRQDGFKLSYGVNRLTNEITLPMNDMSLSTDENGDTYATYIIGGLSNDTDYKVCVTPYKTVEENVFWGPASNTVTTHTPVYVNVDSITADGLHLLRIAESKRITAVVGPKEASEPNLVWVPYHESIIEVTESGTVDATTRYAIIKGLKTGISKLSIIANDDNNYQIGVKAVVVPTKVSNLSGKADKNTVSLSWSASQGATAYAVYRYNTAQNTWVNIAAATGTTYVDTGLSSNTRYQYKIGAYIADEAGIYEGDQTDSIAVTTLKDENAQEPELPFKERKIKNFKISKNYTTKVKLSWTKDKEAKGYEIYQYKSRKWKKITTIKSGSTKSKTIKKLKAGTSYKFRIRGYKTENGKKVYTKYTTLKVMTKPSTVKVTSVTTGSKKITLKWKKVKASGYEIQCCTSKKFKKNVKKVTVKKSSKKATIKKLKGNKTYYVRIRAYSKVNGTKYYGSWSKVKKCKVK